MLGFQDHTRTEEVYLAIRRLKRSKCLEQSQAVGINHDILIKMIDAQPDTLAGTRNRALLSLGYDFLARRSELVAILSDDLKFTPDGALKGMIRKSKTDQYGKGRLVFGSERSAKLVRKWLRLKPAEIQPIFCAINHGKCEDRAIWREFQVITPNCDEFGSARQKVIAQGEEGTVARVSGWAAIILIRMSWLIPTACLCSRHLERLSRRMAR